MGGDSGAGGDSGSGAGSGVGGVAGAAGAGGDPLVESSGTDCVIPALKAPAELPSIQKFPDPFIKLDGTRLAKTSEGFQRYLDEFVFTPLKNSSPAPSPA